MYTHEDNENPTVLNEKLRTSLILWQKTERHGFHGSDVWKNHGFLPEAACRSEPDQNYRILSRHGRVCISFHDAPRNLVNGACRRQIPLFLCYVPADWTSYLKYVMFGILLFRSSVSRERRGPWAWPFEEELESWPLRFGPGSGLGWAPAFPPPYWFWRPR